MKGAHSSKDSNPEKKRIEKEEKKRPRKRRNLLLLNKIMIRIKDQKKSLLKN